MCMAVIPRGHGAVKSALSIVSQHLSQRVSERNKLPVLGTLSTDVAFVYAKDMAMSASTKPFSIVSFQDGSVGVVRSDPRTPRVLEVIAIFADAARARDYADREKQPRSRARK